MKIVTVVGARPQFIKAAPTSRSLRERHSEFLLHTGQHYDDNMSAVFFDELDLPPPDANLCVGSGSHAFQTARMLTGIEEILRREKPDWVLVYGDTNSTLAGALAAAKLQMPVAHVEAGLRSFNRAMPEEINRIIADRISRLLFCPGPAAARNLAREGMERGVYVVGDVMAEALAWAAPKARSGSDVLCRLGIEEVGYLLASIHRAENADNPDRLREIFKALEDLAAESPVILPLHPRTRRSLATQGFDINRSRVRIVEPLGYLDMVRLEQSARMILTDSGGIQKEAYWLSVPCLTLRDETEWTETVETGWNRLVGCDHCRIVQAAREWRRPANHPALYEGTHASGRIVELLEQTDA